MKRRALRRRYGRAKLAPHERERLLRDALFDWASGRAFIRKGRYWLRPLEQVAGGTTVGWGRAKLAPWNKIAIEEWGPSSEKLHDAAAVAYPGKHGQRLLNMRDEGLL